MKIIGHDSSNQYDPEYHELLAHGMMGFYSIDLKRFLKEQEETVGDECEFVPLVNLSNQGIEVPREIQLKASVDEDDWFIGVIRKTTEQVILYWVTGRKFGKYPNGEDEVLPSGCYSSNGASVNEDLLLEALSKTFG